MCAGSTKTCGGTSSWITCTTTNYGTDYEATETSCDGLDNDCDGSIDEGCTCTPNQNQSCGTTDIGECQKGKQTCGADNQWGNCVGEISATEESCDGLDNDCDGLIDENLNCNGQDDNSSEDYQPAELEETVVSSCSDSDPLNDVYTAGQVDVLIDDSAEVYGDICVNENQLFQYSCDKISGEEVTLKKIVYTCPIGSKCAYGVCLKVSSTTALTTKCVGSDKLLPLKAENVCFNVQTRDIELTLFKSAESDDLEYLDFIVRSSEETNIFTCGKNCGACDLLNQGGKTYYINLEEDKTVLGLLLKNSDCVTEEIKIKNCV